MMSQSKGACCQKSRRSFLKLSAMLGITSAVSTLVPAKNAGAFLFGRRKEHKVFKTKLVMGTYVSITAIHSSKEQAEEAISLAFLEIERLNGILSRHLPDTPLSHLNKNGVLKDSPPELTEVIYQSLKIYEQSGGAFDISVLPILDLYEHSFASGIVPKINEIEERLPLVGADSIHIQGNTLSLGKSDMGITTDGIAKGYIVDKASSILVEKGIDNHLINAGGDIKTSGKAAEGKPWAIAVQDPAKDRKYPEIVRMNTGAIATSGNYEIYFDEAKLFHHIVNPKTGKSPHLSKSVTTMAPDVMTADALSTTIFVLEPQEGIIFINSRQDTDCLIVDRTDKIHRSQNWLK